MANKKISALTALAGAPASGDLVPVVDVSDTSQAASGSTKKVTTANLLLLASNIVKTTRVTTTYLALVTDYMIFCDTDGGAFTLTLPPGVEGQHFRIANVGMSGNDLTIDGDSSEKVRQELTQALIDSDILILVYNTVEGWI